LRSTFIYTGIHVSNLRKAISFYTGTLSMRLLFTANIKETGGKVAWLRARGSKQVLELNWYPRSFKYGGKSGLDHLAFEVKDVSAAYKEMMKKYRGLIEPFQEGRWMLAYIADPDGNWIELCQQLRKKKRVR
jgi:catechol 2,3-dioxygenase-like lactoylglutathione lyase family enzyme